MKSRVKALFRNVGGRADMVIILNGVAPHIDMSFFYFTGLSSGIFEQSALLLHRDGRMEIITSRLEEEAASKAKAEVLVFDKKEARDMFLSKRMRSAKRIGINYADLTQRNFESLKKVAGGRKFVDVSDDISDTRLVKDEAELKNIRKAAQIATRAYGDVGSLIKPGIREYELSAMLSNGLCMRGSSGVAFGTIVAFGSATAEPHYTPGSRRLKRGDLIVLDFGAKYNMYCSDITRTLVMGRASKRQREIFDTVLEANGLAIEKVRTGVTGKALYSAVKQYIDEKGFEGKFTHGLGHSLGLQTHDGSGLNASVDVKLKNNMVFTIEPGIYIPGFGGARVEDDVVVKGRGCEVLTKASRELLEL